MEKFYKEQAEESEKREKKIIALLENAAKAYRKYLTLFDDNKTARQIAQDEQKLHNERPKRYGMSKWAEIIGGTKTLNDGAEIPMIGLGSNKIVDQVTLNDFIQSALEIGYRLFDTAEQYVNERELGCAIKTVLPKVKLKREDIFITTKVRIEDGNAASWAEQSVVGSLKKFDTTYLDLVLIHYPRDRKAGSDDAYETNKKSRREAWKKLEQLKEEGLIRSIGVSNFEVYHLVELLEYAKAFSSLARGNQEILKEAAVQEPAKRFDVSPQVNS
ncbi:oxidoreductase, aldo/keto reductase family protein [Ancylostoma ceylanicum]|uniref:Oxidoreductase, aldo/keto reductase family protein n=1 Tax=Ancylostoma ceylanicum TaxID=53326 RepID=A0A0D6LKR6_9BILA|nr:oxidoreductase, aldo/keto reductase family protein [Ancylostoma ceylanicum]